MSSVKCPKCGKKIQKDWIRCPYCKEMLMKKCPECKKNIERKWEACPYCGAEISTQINIEELKTQIYSDKTMTTEIEELPVEDNISSSSNSLKSTKFKKTKIVIKCILVLFLIYLISSISLSYYLGIDNPVAVVIDAGMEPTYYRGDLIFIKNIDPKDLTISDVIVFKRPYQDIPIVARIIDIVEENGSLFFVTKGDNNPFENSYFENSEKFPGVPEHAILGKSIFRIPKLGYVTIFFKRLIGVRI